MSATYTGSGSPPSMVYPSRAHVPTASACGAPRARPFSLYLTAQRPQKRLAKRRHHRNAPALHLAHAVGQRVAHSLSPFPAHTLSPRQVGTTRTTTEEKTATKGRTKKEEGVRQKHAVFAISRSPGGPSPPPFPQKNGLVPGVFNTRDRALPVSGGRWYKSVASSVFSASHLAASPPTRAMLVRASASLPIAFITRR